MQPDRFNPQRLRADWEERAISEGSSYRGVLLRNLPHLLNNYLHEQHTCVIQQFLLSRMPPGSKVLDAGCGYGRISAYIREIRPDISLIGIDFAPSYCQLYKENIAAPAICADFACIPLPYHCLDGLIAVTALMYFPENQRTLVASELIKRLKPGGLAFFIDPGLEYLNLLGGKQRVSSTTSGSGISLKTYDQLGNNPPAQIKACGGWFGFSFLLPLLYVTRRQYRLTKYLLQVANVLDKALASWRRFSLHRWMLVQRLAV